MFDDQADEVMKIATGHETFASTIGDHWDSEMSGYTAKVTMVRTLWIGIKPIALEYIEENMPDAWFKPMFVTKGTKDVE